MRRPGGGSWHTRAREPPPMARITWTCSAPSVQSAAYSLQSLSQVRCRQLSKSLLRDGFDFFDPGRLAAEFADVVQLCAANATGADDFNFVDYLRVERKNALDSVSE